ncbi:hypothetical protein CI610_01903 [invertebrate metagenome]|uniref:DUF1722 domain-containing protein n=1 Tax=invertebrate metagenome TaxID=1711999 RepID=A0A2H9T7C2_9ZZZZ
MAIVPLDGIDIKPAIGISSCLLGQKVRYNGGHKKSSFCVNDLAPLVEFIPVCPEVGIGLGVPREPIRLVGGENVYRVQGTEHQDLDVTEPLEAYAKKKCSEIQGLSGYILMQKSPSCGMERVKIYHPNGNPSGFSGSGIYARTLMTQMPALPVEEEGRLHDPVLRENFFTRVYAYKRWQQLLADPPKYSDVVEFHGQHKYLLMAHYPQNYQNLGRYVAQGRHIPFDEFLDGYIRQFMDVLSHRANRKSHTNALLHLMGYVKKTVGGDDRQRIMKVIETYRQGMVPLITPVSLLSHFLEQYGDDYVKKQVYLNPYPECLGLRNTI